MNTTEDPKLPGSSPVRSHDLLADETPKTNDLLGVILSRSGILHQGNAPEEWVKLTRQLERELSQCVTALKAVANRKTIGDEFDARKLVAAALKNTKSATESANGGTQRGRDDDAPPATETQSRPSLK
jgi:hypothetical protein